MSLRTLVKQKKQEARLTHPAASYSSTGKLTCLDCSVPIKHEALFASHLASKQHRTNAQARAAQLQAQAQHKRTREEAAAAAAVVDYGSSDEERDTMQEDEAPERKRARLDEAAEPVASTSALPADFFADPSQAPLPSAPSPEPESAAAAEEDDDWLAFQRDVLGPATAASAPAVFNNTSTATIFAEPVLYGDSNEEKAEAEEEAGEPAQPEETEAEKAARLAQEEREELYSRIEECVRSLDSSRLTLTLIQGGTRTTRSGRAGRSDEEAIGERERREGNAAGSSTADDQDGPEGSEGEEAGYESGLMSTCTSLRGLSLHSRCVACLCAAGLGRRRRAVCRS